MVQNKQFVNLLDAPYSRRGSYFAFANNNNGEDLYGKCTLWLCNCRTATALSLDQSNGFRQIKLELIKEGKVLPSIITTTPYEVILDSAHGSVRFCIGERKLIACKGEDGLGLRISPTSSVFSPGMYNLMDGTWQIGFRVTKLQLVPFNGKVQAAPGAVEVIADENGVINFALEEFMTDPVRRSDGGYPSYDECVASVKADFDGFCESIAPKLPEKYEEKRRHALWQTWNMIVDPEDGGESDYKHTMVKMIHCIFEAAFAWQQPMQAIWLSNDINLAWDVFLSVFDHQDKNGRIVDALGYRVNPSEALKPPIQGTALLWLMENRDLSSIPAESKAWLWERMKKWTDYFRLFRDKDKDGILEFQSLIETGWEDAPYFNVGFPNASPDLNAYIALQMEALAKLGREIGKPEDECKLWEDRSKELVEKIVKNFWDGERWFAFNAETKERSDSSTISLYTALILGKRLPQDIIDKSIAFIYSKDGFDTEYGLASEGLTSVYFMHGFTRGSVITPAEFIMSLAFEACGRPDLAKDVANKYCAIMRDHGFFHIHNALTGKEDRSLTAFGERGLFWSAWASSCYFYFAERYGE